MNVSADTMTFCLIGRPVSKSLSPLIHNYVFRENKIDACYLAFDVSKESLYKAVEGIRALNIKGFNITIPHKVEIIEFLDEVDEEASLIGAVNTVKNSNGKLIGYNTDGKGFIHSLNNSEIDIVNKNVLIIGAGGAARAISISMAMYGVKSIQIINRSIEKAESLANEISNKIPNVTTFGTDMRNIKTDRIDIVVNCTSVGMYPMSDYLVLNPCIFNKSTIICDIVYKPLNTKFLSIAKQNGYKTITGIDMLIYQGLLSQEIWLNRESILTNFEKVKRIINNIVEY